MSESFAEAVAARRRGSLPTLAILALLGIACSPSGADGVPPAVSAHDAWARAADSGGTTAVYFVIRNAGAANDTLRAVSSTAAAIAGMHVSVDRGGTTRMIPLGSLTVSGRDSVVFRPLGVHVMLNDLRASLADGDTLPLTLEFTSGTTIAVPVTVRPP